MVVRAVWIMREPPSRSLLNIWRGLRLPWANRRELRPQDRGICRPAKLEGHWRESAGCGRAGLVSTRMGIREVCRPQWFIVVSNHLLENGAGTMIIPPPMPMRPLANPAANPRSRQIKTVASPCQPES